MIGVVILNYNNWLDTIECIKSLQKIKTEQNLRIYVVDNSSTVARPGCFEELIKLENITFIQSKVNKGYAAGNNLGIKAALDDDCQYIMIANNDIVFIRDIFERIVDFFRNNPNTGIVAPKCLTTDGMVQETNLGCKMTMKGKFLYMLRKTPFSYVSKKFVDNFRVSFEDCNNPIRVFGVMGCCFVISKECINQIGFLDENTFLYEEENILACKMEVLNLDTYILPELEVVHKHSQSTKSVSTFSYACLVNSEQYYCKEYLSANIISRLFLKTIRVFVFLALWIRNSRELKECKQFFETIYKGSSLTWKTNK